MKHPQPGEYFFIPPGERWDGLGFSGGRVECHRVFLDRNQNDMVMLDTAKFGSFSWNELESFQSALKKEYGDNLASLEREDEDDNDYDPDPCEYYGPDDD